MMETCSAKIISNTKVTIRPQATGAKKREVDGFPMTSYNKTAPKKVQLHSIINIPPGIIVTTRYNQTHYLE